MTTKAASHLHETFGLLGYLKNKTGRMMSTHCPFKIATFQGEHILHWTAVTHYPTGEDVIPTELHTCLKRGNCTNDTTSVRCCNVTL